MSDRVLQLKPLHAGQVLCRDGRRRFNVIACGRRWGKTTLFQELAAGPALYGYPVGYFAPRYKLLADFWRELIVALEPVTSKRLESERRLEIVGGGVIECWTLEDPDAGRSRKYKRIIVDEAGLVKTLRTIWSGALRPTLADLVGDAFIGGTPKGLGSDFEWMFKREASGASKWQSFQRPTENNPFISPEEIAEMRDELGDLFAAQEIDALFVDTSSAERFLPHPSIWHNCYAGRIESWVGQPEVVALDAAVSGDSFAFVAVSRHPDDRDKVVERHTKIWTPEEFEDDTIDQGVIEEYVRDYLADHNVVQLTYDPYQCHYLASRLKDSVWTDEFTQGAQRLEADRQLLDLLVGKRFLHSGDPNLTAHMMNAYRKTDSGGRQIRIVKGSPDLKVDAAVALSMATARCLALNLY